MCSRCALARRSSARRETNQSRSSGRSQPTSLGRSGNIKKVAIPSATAGKPPQREKPPQSGKPKPVNPQDGSRNRPADDKPDRDGGHEPRDRLGSVLIDKPVGKVNNHARKEACFRRTKEETRPVKLG